MKSSILALIFPIQSTILPWIAPRETQPAESTTYSSALGSTEPPTSIKWLAPTGDETTVSIMSTLASLPFETLEIRQSAGQTTFSNPPVTSTAYVNSLLRPLFSLGPVASGATTATPSLATCADCAVIFNVEPRIVILRQNTTFTIVGRNLKKSSAVYIGETVISKEFLSFSANEITVKVNFPIVGQYKVTVQDSGSANIVFVSDVAEIHPKSIDASESGPVVTFSNVTHFSWADPVCVFESNGFFGEIPAIFNGVSYECKSQSTIFSTPGRIYVKFVYDRPRIATRKYPDIKNITRPEIYAMADIDYIAVFAPAPRLIGAQFKETGAAIIIQFSKAVQIIDSNAFVSSKGFRLNVLQSEPCSQIFNSSSIYAKLGKGCVAISNVDTITLQLSAEFSNNDPDAVMPNQLIELLPNTIVASNYEFSRTTDSQKVLINQPNLIVSPNIVVSYAQVIGACSNLTLDFSQTSAGVSRPWKLSLSSDDSAVNDWLFSARGKLTDNVSLTLDGSVMKDFKSYIFNATVSNFLGGSSYQVFKIQKIRDNLPNIVLAGRYENVRVSSFLLISAKSIPSCEINSTVIFEWHPESVILGLPKIVGGPVLSIPPFTLKPGKSYNFTLKAGYINQSLYNFDVNVQTAKDLLTVNAGSSKTIGSENSLFQMPTIIDDAYEILDYSIFQCNWSCTDQANAPCLLQMHSSSCDERNFTGLPPGKYRFDLNVTNLETLTTAIGDPAFITIVNGFLPVVDIQASDLFPGINSPTFFLQAKVDSASVKSSKFSYQWISHMECYGNLYSQIALIQDNTTLTNPNFDDALVFAPGVLMPSSSYCLTLSVTDPSTYQTGIASINFRTRDIPSGGVCQVVGSATVSGPFIDPVIVKCSGWSTDSRSTPLQYKTLIKRTGSSKWGLISPLGPSSTFESVLSQGVFDLKMQLEDSAFSSNAIEQIYRISVGQSIAKRHLLKRSGSVVASAIQHIGKAKAAFIQNSNYLVALLALKNAISTLPDSGSPKKEGQELWNHIVEFLRTLIDSKTWILDPFSNAPFAAELLSEIVENEALTHHQIQIMLSLADEILLQSNSLVRNICYDSYTANEFFDVYDALLSKTLFSPELRTVNATIANISACQFKNRRCGQSPSMYVGNSFNHSFASVRVSQLPFFSRFSINTESSEEQCIKFTETVMNVSALISPNISESGNISLDKRITSLTFLNSSLNIKLISGSLELSPYLSGLLGKVSYPKVFLITDFEKLSNISQTGYTKSIVNFKSDKAGNFIIALVPIPVTFGTITEMQSPSATQVPENLTQTHADSANVYAILGGVIGAVIFVVIVALVIRVCIKKKRERRRYQEFVARNQSD